MFQSSSKFQRAIVRIPPPNFADGLTTAGLGKPDYQKALLQHEKYCETLEKCGLQLIRLNADSRFPDSCFVEDTAVVIDDDYVVITIPGHAARNGEQDEVENVLAKYRKILKIVAPGTLDGGDVLYMGEQFFIGLSNRTNEEGARQLSRAISACGKSARTVPLDGILHLKTGITAIGDDEVVCVEQFLKADEFQSISNKICLPDHEKNAANCLFINGTLLVPEDCSEFVQRLQASGKHVIPMPLSEFQKMDGGLSCLSIRF